MTIVLVLMAACANASAVVLLRKAAMTGSPAPSISFRHLWTLLRRPLWAVGMATIVLGFPRAREWTAIAGMTAGLARPCSPGPRCWRSSR